MLSLLHAGFLTVQEQPGSVALSLIMHLFGFLYTCGTSLILLAFHLCFQLRLWLQPVRRCSLRRCDEAYFARLGAHHKAAARVPSHLALILNRPPPATSLATLVWTGLCARISSRFYPLQRQARARRIAHYHTLIESVRAVVRSAALAGVEVVSVFDASGALSSIFDRVQRSAHEHLDCHGEDTVLPRSIFAIAHDVVHTDTDVSASLCPAESDQGPGGLPYGFVFGLLALATTYVPAVSSVLPAFQGGRMLLMWAHMARDLMSRARSPVTDDPDERIPNIKVQLSLASSPSRLDAYRFGPTEGEKGIRLHIIGPKDGKESLARVASILHECLSIRAADYADAAIEAREDVRQLVRTDGHPAPPPGTQEVPKTRRSRRGFEWRTEHRWARRSLISTISPATISRGLTGACAISTPP